MLNWLVKVVSKKDGYFIEYRESQDVVTRIIAPVFKGKGGTFLGALGVTPW